MDMYDVRSIEFLDFDGVDEKEQIRVKTSLQQNDPSVQLPWIKAEQKIPPDDKRVTANDPAGALHQPITVTTTKTDTPPPQPLPNNNAAAATINPTPSSYPDYNNKPTTSHQQPPPPHQHHYQQHQPAVMSPPPAIINNLYNMNHHHHPHMVPVYYSQAHHHLSPMSPPFPQAVFIPGPAEVPILQVAAGPPPQMHHHAPYHTPPQSTTNTYAAPAQPQPYPHHVAAATSSNFHNGVSPPPLAPQPSHQDIHVVGPSSETTPQQQTSYLAAATVATVTVSDVVPQPPPPVASSGPSPSRPSPNVDANADEQQQQQQLMQQDKKDVVEVMPSTVNPAVPVIENGITSPLLPAPPAAVATVLSANQSAAAAAPAANKSWASLFNSKAANGVVSPSPVTKRIVDGGGGDNYYSTSRTTASLNESTTSEKSNKTAAESNINNNNNNNNVPLCPIKNAKKMTMQFVDPDCYRMGEFLMSHQVDGRTISLQPRGLLNQSNYCYVNSILQALIACPPFYNLLNGLSQNISSNEKRKPTPVIDGMCRFVKEFNHLPANLRVNNRRSEGGGKAPKKDQGVLINTDIPFEASWIYRMLNGIKSDLIEGRQEDAEEFLGCLLNGLNDEMLELIRLVKNNDDETELIGANINNNNNADADNWQVMGPKNKGSFTRRTDFGRTPVSDIFGGFLKSRILRAGDHISENIQPFFTLQLNIEKVNTVREALEALVMKNQLEGLTSSKTNEEVEAWQQVILDGLPVILILHLKCFDYKMDGCTKIVKALEFPVDLKIDSKLLSSKTLAPKERQYKLFAVVYHDGKEASKGHYVTDAFHVGYSSWLRYDDASVKPVLEEHVLKPQGTRVPYLLFYRRCDTIRSNK